MPQMKVLLDLWKDYFYDLNGKTEKVVNYYNNKKREGAANKLWSGKKPKLNRTSINDIWVCSGEFRLRVFN